VGGIDIPELEKQQKITKWFLEMRCRACWLHGGRFLSDTLTCRSPNVYVCVCAPFSLLSLA
jgi:hypothetical protein